ncbi:hypothetical protein Dfri01_39380 [Dyadobacter frigoris]|uniref:hypothetical protein n=1 Tax=Dyadobacter frigoris TaxID=2576211 RepID=UPI0024A3E090|nr:hypothetical protein [Dyadobacter frigoris]GLU54477.1 hypothetical protein Dfri01_39380 [Dyadobacter frigoris]
MARISITQLKTKSSVKMTNLETQLVQLARKEIAKDISIDQLKNSLKSELNQWKSTRDKYKNATTEIDHRYSRQLFIRNKGIDLVVFESAY